MNKYVEWLSTAKGKAISMFLFTIVTLFFGWNLQHISFDFEFEKFFPRDDPDSQMYESHKEQFGYDNDFLHIILTSKDGLFNEAFIKTAMQFEDSLRSIELVESVVSPLSQKHLINAPTGLLSFPLIHADNPARLASDSIRIFGNDFYSSFFSSDKKSLGIYLTHFHFEDQEASKVLINRIDEVAANLAMEGIRVVGKLTAQNVFIDFIQRDFGKFLIGSIVLSLSLLLIIFRNFKASLLPFSISVLSLIWLFGLIGFLGIKINLLSSLLPPILFFVSMSDAVHLMNAVYKSSGETMTSKLKGAISIVWTPTFLTSFTTAVGFLSLVWINTQPIQTLGLFAAIGVLFAFIITFSLGLVASFYLPAKNQKKMIQLPGSLVDLLLRNKKTVLVSSLLIMLILLPGISRLKVNAYLLDDLPENSQVRLDFEFADEFLQGSKPYELRIETKGTYQVWDKEVMDQIRKMEEYLANQYPIGRVQSPSTLMKYLNQVNNGGLNQNYSYPEAASQYKKAFALVRRMDPEVIGKMVTPDAQTCRIFGFFPELGSYETKLRNEKMLDYLESEIDHSVLSYRLTGTTFLIDKSHELLSWNLIKGLLTAILIIGVVLGIYFRSFKLILISLIPNIVPLLIVAGVLGWFGIALKMTTSIIFTIAFGIAVDDTIHMMSYYLKTKNLSTEEALKSTFTHAGSAMLITSIIVIAGFSLFLLSEFGATFYLGLFVSLSLLVALVVDLTLLPLLLTTFHKKNAKKG